MKVIAFTIAWTAGASAADLGVGWKALVALGACLAVFFCWERGHRV